MSTCRCLHDGDSTCSRTRGHAEGGIGLTQTVQATILKDRSVASEESVGDIAHDDFSITQASGHLAVGVHTTVRGSQASVFAADACDRVGDHAGSVGGDGVHGVQALVAFSDEGLQLAELTATDEASAGVSRNGLPRECVEHNVAGETGADAMASRSNRKTIVGQGLFSCVDLNRSLHGQYERNVKKALSASESSP